MVSQSFFISFVFGGNVWPTNSNGDALTKDQPCISIDLFSDLPVVVNTRKYDIMHTKKPEVLVLSSLSIDKLLGERRI
jgi:hypothetical protein